MTPAALRKEGLAAPPTPFVPKSLHQKAFAMQSMGEGEESICPKALWIISYSR